MPLLNPMPEKGYEVTIETDEMETYHNVLAHVRTDSGRLLMLDLGNAILYFNLDYVRSYRVEVIEPASTQLASLRTLK
jgi:hypothetical protein